MDTWCFDDFIRHLSKTWSRRKCFVKKLFLEYKELLKNNFAID